MVNSPKTLRIEFEMVALAMSAKSGQLFAASYANVAAMAMCQAPKNPEILDALARFWETARTDRCRAGVELHDFLIFTGSAAGRASDKDIAAQVARPWYQAGSYA
ncbi:MAG: hypothetical protein JKY93_03550 [Gammaproteobacteria bacterium]|nr:hypothetical protein [Gammaproteobacteria bacterium]